MPTEAEWTYASHTGVSTRRHFGDDNRLLVHYANCRPASNDRLMEVGRLLPNRFGLFDTLGNVSEWLLDPHGVDDVAGTPPERYVIAGGSAFTPADGVYVDMDYHYPAAFAGQRVGLRVAQSLPAAEPGEMPFALAVDRPMAAEMPRMGEPRKLEYIPFADLAQPLPMGRFRRGSEPVRFLRISNLADRPIRLEHLIAEGRLSISSNAERVVPVGKSVQLEVTLDSSVPLDQVGLLHWQCRPEGGEPSGYALRVHGYAEGPMLHLIGGTVEQNRAAHVDFGKLPLGGVLRQTFSFFNNGDEPLTVELLEVAGAIQIRRREELRRIKPGAYAAIEVEVDTDTEQVRVHVRDCRS